MILPFGETLLFAVRGGLYALFDNSLDSHSMTDP